MAGARSGRHTSAIELEVPRDFDFRATVYSHGWCVLAPFAWSPTANRLDATLPVRRGVTRLALSQPEGRGRAVRLEITGGTGARSGLEAPDWDRIQRATTRMLRLDARLEPFHRQCRRAGGNFARAARAGFGRLLRAPTLYEDMVKILATTNTTWAATKGMVTNLVDLAGSGGAFPGPEAVASLGARRLAAEGRWGYRAEYLQRLSADVCTGRLELDRWEHWTGPTKVLEREIRAVRGFGPYASAHILALLGRYDRIGVDTVFRTFVRRKYFPRARKPPSDRRLLSVYADWGSWRGLAYWADLWHEHEFEDL